MPGKAWRASSVGVEGPILRWILQVDHYLFETDLAMPD